ncbi:hypothetical protein [Sphingomonas sp. TZW2008]|uniref:hypothetical protein n=1 Tax=Sphingomonas sp. TZW2008 TaxID=1917973 RepID=UPI000A26E4DB|nr:hypothetical protein [Sphingomonas sp. TZW2008]
MVADMSLSHGTIVGHVEKLGEIFGTEGWVLDQDDPSRALDVELWAGGEIIAVTTSGIDRPDVARDRGIVSRPGFCFDPSVCDQIVDIAASGAEGELSVRVRDPAITLQSFAPPRSLEAVRRNAATSRPATVDALFERLSQQIGEAEGARQLAKQWATQHATGFIEAICVDESGLIWVTGWMVDDGVADRPIVILDDGEYAGSFAYALAPRDDLPVGCLAFAGVVHSAWRPRPGPPFRMFMADGSARILQSLDPVRLMPRATIAPVVRDVVDQSTGPHRAHLHALFHFDGGWSVDQERASAERVQIDEAAVLPGFGVFVNGWALSPRKAAHGFMLKAGTTIARAEESSIVRYRRPDLDAMYRHVDQALAPAGFIALFRGTFDDASIDEMIVKTTWNDGKSTAAAIAPTAVRVIGRTAPIETVERYYPAIEAERFFASFARHAATTYRTRALDLRSHAVEPVEHAMIFVVPSSRSDYLLLVDDIVRNARRVASTTGIVLVAGADIERSLLLSSFTELQRHSGLPCSLYFSGQSRPTSDAVDPIATALGATTFAFIAGHVRLTERGWSIAGTPASDISLLAVDDPADTTAAPTISADAVVAALAAWQAEIAANPSLTAGAFSRTPLIRADTHPIIRGAAVSLGRPPVSPLAARIDRALGFAHV